MRIAVIGGGIMGEAIMRALLRREPCPQIVVAEKRAERAAQLVSDLGVTVADARDAVVGADVVILAVKPQDIRAVLDDIGADIAAGTLVLSIAAGIPTSVITQQVSAGVNVVRAMPNTPARIDMGVTGISAAPGCTPKGRDLARDLLGSIGTVVEVPEELQDSVTAVSGSGPAYLFLLAESMLASAIELGLDPQMADLMVRQTLLGAAQLLATSSESPDVLRQNVTSPNGTTAAALTTMHEHGVSAGIEAGMAAARARSRALAES
jgi:pyrroline-5-carboxylate reductase